MSIKLQLLPPIFSGSTTPLKIKVVSSTKISALIHTYLVKSKLPLSQKESLSVWLEEEELELGATVAEEEISSGEKLRIVYTKKVDKGKGRAMEPALEKGKGKGKERRREDEEEEDELDEGPEWDDAFLREVDLKSKQSRPPAPSTSSKQHHLQPSTSAANSSATTLPAPPRPNTTAPPPSSSSSSKRQRFNPLGPQVAPSANLTPVVPPALDEEEDEFSSMLFPDDLLASIDLPTTTTTPLETPTTSSSPPHPPPNTPNYLPSPSRLLALQERLSAAAPESPSSQRRVSSSPSSTSKGGAQPRPVASSSVPSTSRSRSEVVPSPVIRSSDPPRKSNHPSSSSSSSSSSTAAEKLAQYRYTALPPPASQPPPKPEPTPSPSPPPKSSSPPRSSQTAPFVFQPFGPPSSSSQPASTAAATRPRIKDVYGDDTADDFFSNAVDPLDGYEQVKQEEEERRGGLLAFEDASTEKDELAEDPEEQRETEQRMVVDFWGGGGMVKVGEESGPPASFVRGREEREGEGETGWVYEEEGGGGMGLAFEGDDGEGLRLNEVGGVGGFVASLPVVREEEEEEEEEVDELAGDDGGEEGAAAVDVGLEKANKVVMAVDVGRKGEEVGEREKRVVAMPLPPTPESLPRPNPPTSTNAAPPPPRPSFVVVASTTSSPPPPPPPSRNLTIAHLPSSVLYLIFLQTIDPFCLSNLSILLTSKLFHSVARPILYRVVSLRSTQGWNSFFISGSPTELRSFSETARRKEDYDAVEELEIHAAGPKDASDLSRIDMVLALHDISSKRGRKLPFVPNSTPLLPKLTKLTLSFPPNSPTSSLDYSIALKPFHPALLKSLSFPSPTVEITLIGVRNTDQVRAVFGTVQGVKKVVLERPAESGRRELSEMAGKSGGRIEVPAGDEGWVPTERVEEWRKKSVWVGML